jgi:SAM-dependent methyltransferase
MTGAFAVSAGAYDRFMGRYSETLARRTVELLGLAAGERALDVGCGPGALTAALASVVGAEHVAAVDPSPGFASSCASRIPGADVRVAGAEALPFADGEFDLVVAQLVLHFVADSPAAVRELRRVTRPGGRVAASVWDLDGGMTMLRTFWDAAVALDPSAPDERELPQVREGELAALWRSGGLSDVEDGVLRVEAAYDGFDDFWQGFLGGVGPAGAYLVSLDEERRARLSDDVRRRLGDPTGPFTLPAAAWYAVGRV